MTMCLRWLGAKVVMHRQSLSGKCIFELQIKSLKYLKCFCYEHSYVHTFPLTNKKILDKNQMFYSCCFARQTAILYVTCSVLHCTVCMSLADQQLCLLGSPQVYNLSCVRLQQIYAKCQDVSGKSKVVICNILILGEMFYSKALLDVSFWFTSIVVSL